MELTPEERRRIRLAKNIARGVRYFLYFVIAGVLALLAAGIWISVHGVREQVTVLLSTLKFSSIIA